MDIVRQENAPFSGGQDAIIINPDVVSQLNVLRTIDLGVPAYPDVVPVSMQSEKLKLMGR
ncbi:MAG: hypothetical protein Q8O19_07195 [Rectinemataceae bacterium]|nr:hypothetical protein [Rectinemataceae bacterium]